MGISYIVFFSDLGMLCIGGNIDVACMMLPNAECGYTDTGSDWKCMCRPGFIEENGACGCGQGQMLVNGDSCLYGK